MFSSASNSFWNKSYFEDKSVRNELLTCILQVFPSPSVPSTHPSHCSALAPINADKDQLSKSIPLWGSHSQSRSQINLSSPSIELGCSTQLWNGKLLAWPCIQLKWEGAGRTVHQAGNTVSSPTSERPSSISPFHSRQLLCCGCIVIQTLLNLSDPFSASACLCWRHRILCKVSLDGKPYIFAIPVGSAFLVLNFFLQHLHWSWWLYISHQTPR